MSKTQHGHQHDKGRSQDEGHSRSPCWRQVHHHWYFWIGMLLMLVAIGNYVVTEDLSRLPRSQPQQPPSNADGK